MNLSDFDALRLSLCKFEPAVQAFCVQYGFKQRAIGRYPKLRLERTRADSQINQWIDLWMKYDDEGKYRTSWDENAKWSYDDALLVGTSQKAVGLLISETNGLTGIGQFTRGFSYDAFGRSAALATILEGITYYQRTTYDQYGRVFQSFDASTNAASPPSSTVRPKKFRFFSSSSQ